MTWHWWAAATAGGLAVAALVIALVGRRLLLERARVQRADAAQALVDEHDGSSQRVAFVANPTKPGADDTKERALAACAARGLPEPLWFDTTAEDPGEGQAREAVAAGAEVVVAVGGDGTVRAVAQALAGTPVPMALLPQGTGNLLARNLDLPLGDLDELLRIALVGLDRMIDVGRLTVHAGEAAGTSHLFLVIAGVGFDAAMVADTDEQLKAKVGWVAYFVAGIRHLHARRLRIEARLDDGQWYALRLRTLLIGNCGRLPGGITLLPDALIDDGWLDVGAIDVRAGMLGWTQLFGAVVAQGFGVRADLPGSIGHIDHARARTVRLRLREPQPVQVDGDIVGGALELEAVVEPRALTVRVA